MIQIMLQGEVYEVSADIWRYILDSASRIIEDDIDSDYAHFSEEALDLIDELYV